MKKNSNVFIGSQTLSLILTRLYTLFAEKAMVPFPAILQKQFLNYD